MSPNLHVWMLLVLAPVISGAASPPGFRIETVAGSGRLGDGGPAIAAQMGNIQGIAADRAGNIYFSDTDNHRVRKVDANGVITTLAGTGEAGFSGDSGPAAAAKIKYPYGVAVDTGGNVYFCDVGNDRVRRIRPDGIITTVAGTGVHASSGEAIDATKADLLTPRNLAVDSSGNLYISEFEGHSVRKVARDGRITRVAGTGVAGFNDDGKFAVLAQLNSPAGLAVDSEGALYIADSQNLRVRKVTPDGQISTLFGVADKVLPPVLNPVVIAVGPEGNVYVADAFLEQSIHAVYAYTRAREWVLVAGTGAPGFSGDGGKATEARISHAGDLAVDPAGNLLIADGVSGLGLSPLGRVRKVDLHGTIRTVAGDGYASVIGDGQSALAAQLYLPSMMALDAAGDLWIADTGTQRIRQVNSPGLIQTFAGTGKAVRGPDATAAAASGLYSPMGVLIDPAGRILIADTYNHRIRRVEGGVVSTVMGTGVSGIGAEANPWKETQLSAPKSLCPDRAGNLFVVDSGNHRVLFAAPGESVLTAAGNGSRGFAGDGGQARVAQLDQPGACAADSAGNLFIADTGNHRVRKVTAAGVITTVAGTGDADYWGDEGPAAAAALKEPRGIAVDDNGNLYISDSGNNLIRMVTPDGIIHRIAGVIAGKDGPGFGGDGGPALSAQLHEPGGLLLDGTGNLYFADTRNSRIRRLTPQPEEISDPVTEPAVRGVFSAASLLPGPVAPGEIVTIVGKDQGPAAGVDAGYDGAGLLPTQLYGVEVRFGGKPAPLLYVQADQIRAQVPYTVPPGQSVEVQVFYLGLLASSLTVDVVPVAPAFFPDVVNQDGTIGSAAQPALRSSIVTAYVTGEGLTDGPNVSGACASAGARPLLPVSLTIAGMPAETLYLGSAPGLVGTLQLNIRVPGGLVPTGPQPLQLTIGTVRAPELTIWLK